MDFYDLDLNDDVLDALDAMNFTTCTPIQEHTIPPLLEGRDLIGVAQTGTGKTAAYTGRTERHAGRYVHYRVHRQQRNGKYTGIYGYEKRLSDA